MQIYYLFKFNDKWQYTAREVSCTSGKFDTWDESCGNEGKVVLPRKVRMTTELCKTIPVLWLLKVSYLDVYCLIAKLVYSEGFLTGHKENRKCQTFSSYTRYRHLTIGYSIGALTMLHWVGKLSKLKATLGPNLSVAFLHHR